MKTEPDHHGDDLQLLQGIRGALRAPEPRVEQLMGRDFVSLPAWFSAAQAAKILQQTGKSFALFAGPGGDRLATRAELEAVEPMKSAAPCATPLGPAITIDASLDEAVSLMGRRKLDRVAVVVGRLLVGILTRDAIAERVPILVPQPGFRLAA